ncbi:MAG: response regulator [Candidatus Omnitrophica bacterium]|nr:response regulator [Candidatus Omnitrophota bacterium]
MADIVKRKILVVDDEPDVLEYLKKVLGRDNFEVAVTEKGTQAITLAKSFKPNLIILDLFLPDMEGSEVASQLSNELSTRDIPIIFLSGVVVNRGDNISGQKSGRHYIMAKPVSPQEILAMIKKILG